MLKAARSHPMVVVTAKRFARICDAEIGISHSGCQGATAIRNGAGGSLPKFGACRRWQYRTRLLYCCRQYAPQIQQIKTLAVAHSSYAQHARRPPGVELVAVGAERIPDLERSIQQQENFISRFLGNNPGPIARGMKLTEQPNLPDVSRLLERPPDILAAEAPKPRAYQTVHRSGRFLALR